MRGKFLAAGILGAAALAGEPETPAIFTAAQAEAGRVSYLSTCVNCHTASLIPAADAKYMGQTIPPLAGPDFMSRWGGRTAAELATRINVAIGGFPPKDRDATTWLKIAAYVLQVNGGKPGAEELTGATSVTVQKAAPEAESERH